MAVQITLYGPDDEARETYTRAIIPWGILKKAIALSKQIGKDVDNITEQDIDLIAGFVVDVFGGRFSIEQLNEGADVGEMVAVMQGIVTRASSLAAANPTDLPASKRKK